MAAFAIRGTLENDGRAIEKNATFGVLPFQKSSLVSRGGGVPVPESSRAARRAMTSRAAEVQFRSPGKIQLVPHGSVRVQGSQKRCRLPRCFRSTLGAGFFPESAPVRGDIENGCREMKTLSPRTEVVENWRQKNESAALKYGDT